jgi:hypothetical protein
VGFLLASIPSEEGTWTSSNQGDRSGVDAGEDGQDARDRIMRHAWGRKCRGADTSIRRRNIDASPVISGDSMGEPQPLERGGIPVHLHIAKHEAGFQLA